MAEVATAPGPTRKMLSMLAGSRGSSSATSQAEPQTARQPNRPFQGIELDGANVGDDWVTHLAHRTDACVSNLVHAFIITHALQRVEDGRIEQPACFIHVN